MVYQKLCVKFSLWKLNFFISDMVIGIKKIKNYENILGIKFKIILNKNKNILYRICNFGVSRNYKEVKEFILKIKFFLYTLYILFIYIKIVFRCNFSF